MCDVRFGSEAEDPSMSAARPLHPSQRTNAEASPDVCIGPALQAKISSASWRSVVATYPDITLMREEAGGSALSR